MIKQAVILFTRIPIAGQTKTRLQETLTPAQCAALHSAFLKDIWLTCCAEEWDTFVFYDPNGSLSVLEALLPGAKKYCPQSGSDLGEKMLAAIVQVLQEGYPACVLVGSDLPQLRTEDLREALGALADCDVVLAPTLDGGYYLVGMKKAQKAVFEKQTYGLATVFESTVRAIENAGLSYSAVTPRRDIDDAQDLRALCQSLPSQTDPSCLYSRQYLKSIGRIH